MVCDISIKIEQKNPKIYYNLRLKHNINIILGNSGTGKTTLYELIQNYEYYNNNNIKIYNNGDSSRVKVHALNKMNYDTLYKYKDTLIILDEESDFMCSQEFASQVKSNPSNCYILIYRDLSSLSNLPINKDAIYEIENNGMYHYLRPCYSKKCYSLCNFTSINDIQAIKTEDSGSGYILYQELYKPIKTKSYCGNGNLKNLTCKESLIVVDGAACGSYIPVIMNLAITNLIYMTESLEFILLHSLCFKKYITSELIYTYRYIDCALFISYEQYYTYLLNNIYLSLYGESYFKGSNISLLLYDDNKTHLKSLIDSDLNISEDTSETNLF